MAPTKRPVADFSVFVRDLAEYLNYKSPCDPADGYVEFCTEFYTHDGRLCALSAFFDGTDWYDYNGRAYRLFALIDRWVESLNARHVFDGQQIRQTYEFWESDVDGWIHCRRIEDDDR